MIGNHIVYVLLKNCAPIYVGYTTNITNRVKQHKSLKKDFDNYLIFDRFSSKQEALMIERNLIRFFVLFGDLDTVKNLQYPIDAFENLKLSNFKNGRMD